MAAGDDEEAMADVQPRELSRERLVLVKVTIAVARVEPDVRPLPPEAAGDVGQVRARAVEGKPLLARAEDRGDLVGALVAGPALEGAELTWMVQADVERAVSPFGKPADGARRRGADRSIASIDRPDNVVGKERLPARVGPYAVCPLGVGEASGRAERHHQNHRADLVLRDQLVLDDAGLDGEEQRVWQAGRSVQEIEDGVATVRVGRIARRQVDDHLLATAADRETGDRDRLRGSARRDPGRVVRRCVTSVEPEIVEIAVDADQPGGESDARRREGHGPADRPSPSGEEPAGCTSAAGRRFDLEPAIRSGTRRGHE